MVLIRSFEVPTAGIKFENSGVEAFIDNDAFGKGTLFITEANIAWINGDTAEGFKVAYKKMTLHAISRDPGVHSRACLYIMLNGNTLDDDENFEVECPVDVEEGEEELTEIRFVPDDTAILDGMYKAVQECSLLHPDPSSDLSNDDEDPDENFEGFVEEGGDANAEGLDDECDDDEEAAEAERLEQFMRMQLHFGNQRNDGNQNGNNGNGDGNPPGLNFIPEPGQFDDE